MFKMFKNLKWFLKQEWLKYILIALLIVILTYSLTIPPKYIGIIVDRITKSNLTFEFGLEVFIIMLVNAIVIYLSSSIKNYLLGKLNHNLFYELKIRFLKAVLRQDGDFYEEFYSGDLISRATGDIQMVSRVSTHLLFNLFDTVIMLIFALISLLSLNVELTLYSIIPLPIIFFIVLYFRPKIMRNWRKVRKETSNLNNLVMESVTHAKLIRGFVGEREDEKKLFDKAEEVYKTERKSVIMQSVFQPSFKMVTLLSSGIALAYGSYLIINQRNFSVGDLVSFNLYLGMFASPLFRLGNQITVISQSTVSFDRISEVLNHEESVVDKEDAIMIDGITKIEFNNLSFKYPKDNDYIIKDINLKINPGETIGIVGKTGSGKTTLVRQLLRQFVISKGSLYINGKNVNNLKKRNIREHVAYVPQEHQLFSRTVLENLELGLGSRTDVSVEEAVNLADFTKDLAYLTDSLDTIVGEAGVTLSGGQKQRLSIARAFLKNADVLIMDDSLSAVDGVTEENILKNLKKYRKDKLNIITSHRLSVVEEANKIIVMDKGRIVEIGTHKELIDNKKWYYEQYLAQQMEVNNG